MNKFVTPGKTKVVEGSILTPQYAGLRLILNFSNLAGKTDSPMFNIFDKKWRKIKEENKGWYAIRNNFKLGELLTTAVQSDTWVVNCLCQDEQGKISESALNTCIKKIHAMALNEKASIHVSNLLLEECPELSSLLNEKLVTEGINVSYYQEPKQP